MRRTLLFLSALVLLGIVLNVWEYKTRSSNKNTDEPKQEQSKSGTTGEH